MNIYKITVEKYTYDGNASDGEFSRIETLFEASSTSAARLHSFAPQQVELALADEAYEATPEKVMPGIDGWANPLKPSQGDAPANETVNDAVTARRKRRTKAQIAADEAAALASQAGAEPGPDSEAAVAEAASEAPGAAPVTEAAPWNPFAPKG